MKQTIKRQLTYYETKLTKNEERLIRFSNEFDFILKNKRCDCRRDGNRRTLCRNLSLHMRFHAFITAYEKESKENDRIVLQIKKLEKILK